MPPSSTTRRPLLLGAAAMAALGRPAIVRAAASFGDVTRFVFVPVAEPPAVSVVEIATGQIVGNLLVAFIPARVIVSRTEAQLIITDGKAAGFVTIDLSSLKSTYVPLPHPVERLVLGADGWVLAAADAAGGTITLFDLRRRAIMGRVDGLQRVRDLMFVDQDGSLFVAVEGAASIAVIDVNTARQTRSIGPFGPGHPDILTFARTPNGRSALVQPVGDDPPSIIDIETGHILGSLGGTSALDGVVPSGTGAFLFVPNNAAGTLAVFRESLPATATVLPAAAGMGAVYSGWLDSVAFIACANRRQLLVYDLDHLRPMGGLDLDGTPGQGGVTSDSARLYIPLTAPAGLAVIDAQTRRVTATLPLTSTPLAAIVPGGWGVCH